MQQFPSVGLRLPELWEAVRDLTPEQLVEGSGRPMLVELTGGQTQELAKMDNATVSGSGSGLGRKDWSSTRVLLIVHRREGPQERITVGRAANNDVVIPSANVSKQHAFFIERDGRFGLVDAGSRNGTTIGGESLDPGTPYQVRDGVEIAFGESVFLFVEPASFHATVQGMFPKESGA